MEAKLHRVKICVMTEDEEWNDVGTGHISSKYVEPLQDLCLLVHSDSDGSLIVECKIHLDVSYRKQEDIIIWSEAKNRGMAIHFEDSDGCQAIWEDICQFQGKDPTVENTQDILYDLETFEKIPEIWNVVEMPECERSTLENIASLIISVFETPSNMETLALMLENEDYIKKLLDIFRTCENQQDTEGLHYLYNIIKGILFLNKISLFNIMFSDECIMDVVGCLEYNPDLDQPKRHREFLTQTVKFKEVMPITQFELMQKIHQTYRIEYIHDILLPTPSVFEESLLSDLKSFIFFNKIEIVTLLQEDEFFLSDILAKLKDDTIDDDRRRELFLFFKEFCMFSHSLQSDKKDALLKILINLGIMPILKVAIHMHDYQIKLVAIDIFSYLVEYSPCLVQAFAMEEAQDCEDDGQLILNIIIDQMVCDADPEFSQAINLERILHSLLDPENMHVRPNTCGRSEFLSFFYAHCMRNLIAPLLSVAAQDDSVDFILEHDKGKDFPDNYYSAEILSFILELLTFCVQHHKFYIKNFILTKNLLKNVLVLMTSKHTFLVLGAVRFMRKMIGLKDVRYNRYIIKRNLFEPVVKAFVRNGSRYNMLNSAIIELFEFIRRENIKTLVAHIVEKFHRAFETAEYVQTFKGLKIKYEEQKKVRNKTGRNARANKYKKTDCRNNKIVEVKVKEEVCSERNIREPAIPSTKSEFLIPSDTCLQAKGEKETENEVVHPEISSNIFGCSSSHSNDDAYRMSKPDCSSNIILVDYTEDDVVIDGDGNSSEDINRMSGPHYSSNVALVGFPNADNDDGDDDDDDDNYPDYDDDDDDGDGGDDDDDYDYGGDYDTDDDYDGDDTDDGGDDDDDTYDGDVDGTDGDVDDTDDDVDSDCNDKNENEDKASPN